MYVIDNEVKVFADNSDLSCIIWDESFKPIYFNKKAHNVFEINGDFEKKLPKEYYENIENVFLSGICCFSWKHSHSGAYMVQMAKISFNNISYVVSYTSKNQDLEQQNSKEFSTDVFEQMPLGCNFWDENYKIVYCNKKSMEIFGYDDKDEYIQHFHKAMIGDKSQINAPSIININLTRAINGEPLKYEGWYSKKNGNQIYIKAMLEPIKNNKKCKVLVYFIDETKQKDYERRLEFAVNASEYANKISKIMLDNTPLSITIWDSDFKIIDYNSYALKLLGTTDTEKFLYRYHEFLPEKQLNGRYSLEYHKEVLERAFEQDNSLNCVFQFLKEDGSYINVEGSFARILHNGKYIVISYKKDITSDMEALQLKIDADKRILLMIGDSPIGSNVWTHEYKVIECNRAFLKMLEITDKSIYLNDRTRFTVEYQPDGRLSSAKLKECVDTTFSDGYSKMEWVYKTATGVLVPAEINAVRVTFSSRVLIVTYIRDLRDLHETLAKLNKLEEFAYTDELTGICNRRYFLEYIREEIYNNKKSFTLMMIDIDHFKSVNDTYGHDVGDKVIKHVTDEVSSGLRESDIFARYGGEEFLVLCHKTSIEKVTLLAERLRKKVEESKCLNCGVEIGVSISIGIASLDIVCDTSVDDLIKRADTALYRAKETGRNKVCVYNEIDD